MEQNKSQKLNKKTDKGEVTDTPNPFVMMRQMILSSVGRLPAALVIILVMSVAAASVSAILMAVYERQTSQKEFMPQRLESIAGANPISEVHLQGIWSMQNKNFAMNITLVDKKFEWIIKMKNEGTVLYFLRGNYKLNGDVMVLGGRKDMGAPSDPIPSGRQYMPVDIVDINMRVDVDKKQMIWHVPVSEQNVYKSLIVNIFDKKNQADLVWERLQ